MELVQPEYSLVNGSTLSKANIDIGVEPEFSLPTGNSTDMRNVPSNFG